MMKLRTILVAAAALFVIHPAAAETAGDRTIAQYCAYSRATDCLSSSRSGLEDLRRWVELIEKYPDNSTDKRVLSAILAYAYKHTVDLKVPFGSYQCSNLFSELRIASDHFIKAGLFAVPDKPTKIPDELKAMIAR